MSVQLSELLSEVNEVIRNSTTGMLDNTKRTRAFNRVFGDMRTRADFDFTKRTKEFYFIDGVNEYSLQNYVGCTCLDKDGATSILDFKNPYDLRLVGEVSTVLRYWEPKDVRQDVRRGLTADRYSVDNGILIVNYPRNTSAQLHNFDSLTANGTVSASGDATNLTIDSQTFSEGSASVNFDVSAGMSLVITLDGFTAKDLTTLQNKSHLILDAWLPTITNFTSIKLEWGDDASNNWSKTETAPAGSTSLQTGKNKFAFRWADADENGSPDVSSVSWARVTITYSEATTDTDFRLDDLRIGRETEMELEYYSRAMVKTSAGEYQLEFNPTDVTQTDTLVGEDIARNCVIAGGQYKLFSIVGGESERDRTDSFTEYNIQLNNLIKEAGHRLRRPSKVLNFQRR
jgi:hypothetical protein